MHSPNSKQNTHLRCHHQTGGIWINSHVSSHKTNILKFDLKFSEFLVAESLWAATKAHKGHSRANHMLQQLDTNQQ